MKPTAILDIGSSKIVCLCGSAAVRGGTVVHGAGITEYSGYSEAEFHDTDDLEDAIIYTIRDAEEMARVRIRDIVLSVPGPFSKLDVTSASIRLDSNNERISESDIDELISLSLSKSHAPGYVLMHSTPVTFTIDGYKVSNVPQGQRAGSVSAEVSHMYVKEDFLDLITKILGRLSIEISMCVSTELAEALLLIPDEERIRPSVLLDVGYTNTGIAVIENSALTSLYVLDMGGFQFTSDLGFGLEIPQDAAEQIKRKYSFLQEQDESDTVTIRMLTGVKQVDRHLVDYIMDARASEFADLLGKILRSLNIRSESKPIVYITGGGFSMMRGGSEYLRHHLGMKIRRDMPYMPDMDTPNYTSSFAVLDFVLRAANQDQEEGISSGDSRNLIDKIRGIFIQ